MTSRSRSADAVPPADWPPRARGLHRARHGRRLRSSLAGPYLPRLSGRALDFELAVQDTVAYVRATAPELMEGVSVEVGTMPPENVLGDGIDRWRIEGGSRIILYRVPVERLEDFHCDDPVHLRAAVERLVLDAIADLFGRDPWDIAPDRYGDFD